MEEKNYVQLFEGYYGPKWWSFGVMLGSRGIAILREN
jgi:hypothetical protein